MVPRGGAAQSRHLENKSSVKYSIVWDQAPWRQPSSEFISSKLAGISAVSGLVLGGSRQAERETREGGGGGEGAPRAC